MADFTTFSDGTVTQGLAEQRGWNLYFMHVPTGKVVVFKAWVTQYSESFSSEWESVDSYGRMDPIQTFKRTGRTITLGWDVVAESAADAIENMQRINMLVKMLYPVYRDNYLAAGPVFKFKFANLVSDQGETIVCTLNGLDYQPDTTDAGFVDPGSAMLFPKKVSLTTELTVLHTHIVGWDTEGNWKHGDDSEGINWPFHTGEGGTSAAASTGGTDASDTSALAENLEDEVIAANEAAQGTTPEAS
jgi:hypothetical protein